MSLCFVFIRIYFKNDHDKLDALEMLSTKAFQDLLEGDDDFAPNYPTLTKASVPVYYRILHEELIELVKQRCVNKRDEVGVEPYRTLLLIFSALHRVVAFFCGRVTKSSCCCGASR